MTLDQQVRVLLFRDGPTAYARLYGAVNRDTVPAFQRRLEELLPACCAGLTLDLGAADYLDSDGIRWLHGLQETLASQGAALRLALREGCRADRTLILVRLNHAFDIERYPCEGARGEGRGARG